MTLHDIGRRLVVALLMSAMPLGTVHAIETAPNQDQKLVNLKTKGTGEIDRRVASLEAALSRVAESASSSVSIADKTAMQTQINGAITDLKALKAKLAAETTLAGARADVVNLVTGYRVYTLVLPKARLLATSDRIDTARSRLETLAESFKAKIAQAKADGRNVSGLETALAALNSKLDEVKQANKGVPAALLALVPADYNANKQTLEPYRTSLTASATDLKSAREDAKTIYDGLKALTVETTD